MKRLSKFTLLSSLILVGCAEVPKDIITNEIDANGNAISTVTKTDQQGNKHITQTVKTKVDMTKFASINNPQNKGSMTAYNAPLGLNNIVDIPVFIGDVEDLTYLITAHTGYKYLPYSGIKISPIRVTYEAHGKTALEAFTEVNNLVGDNVTIKISEVAKTVQIIYPLSALTFE